MKYTYKKLLTEKQFLKVSQRARALRGSGSDLIAIYYQEKRLIFKTRSATNKKLYWTQTIEVSDLTLENVFEKRKFKDVEDIIKNSGLKVHCSCPAFLYWGFKYLSWKKGYGLEKEIRRPRIRNPFQKGYVCKHLYFVLQLYPFWSKYLASKFLNYYEGQNEKVLDAKSRVVNKKLSRVV